MIEPTAVGRYELVALLGSGGMAEVYRAIDPTLGRAVALKCLRGADDDQLERFMHEARAQAHVEHPGICKVYEVGSADGRPFIAMQCIEGLTLAQAAPHMSLDAKVAVMADIADAVHAAHRVGLVHRDLKPSNIMLEQPDDKQWHAYVLDFGLARDQAASRRLTTVGLVMGTPSYMAPEQARGERNKIDRRTDVYGLGATLYELLTGRPPFEGDTAMDILLKLIGFDPEPPRNIEPSIPADLETIVLKCLEKDPQRRYDSARALADDLRRYLNGEPIDARRASLAYRLRTRARRHPTMTAILAIALVAVLASTTAAFVTAYRSAEVARAAQHFGQEVERIEAVARYSRMLPLHDIARDRAGILDSIAVISRERHAIGRAAAGPAEYAIGRGYLTLEDYDASRAHLEAAWNAGYRTPEVSYALGRAIGAQYERELKDIDQITSKDAREQRRKAIERAYRDVALQYLRTSAASAPSAMYAEGLIALYEKKYDTALARARSAFTAVPWLYEAKKLEADALLEQGIRSYDSGRYDDAQRSYAAAGDAYAIAARIAPSDANILLGDSERWFRTMQIAVNRGGDPNDALQHGVATAEAAARTGARVEDSLVQRALILLRFGEWQLQEGIVPEALDRSIAMASQAINVNPKSARAYSMKGASLFSKARYAATHGQDPIAIYDESIRNQRRAVELAPRIPQMLLNLGNALRRKAEALEGRGQDGTALVDESIVYYDRAVAAAEPPWANVFNDRTLAFLQRGEWEMAKGRDPMASLAEAVSSAERATKLNPMLAAAYVNLGNAHYDRGAWLLQRGDDARSEAEAGAAASLHALTINPKLPSAHVNASEAYIIGAQWAVRNNEDPHVWTSRAIDEATKALAIDPNHASACPPIAVAHLCDAKYAVANRRDASKDIAAAREAIARADKLNPNDADTLTTAAEIEDIAGNRAAAESLLKRSLAINPTNREALELRDKLAKVTNQSPL